MLPLINSGIKWPTRFSADHDITTAVNPLADLTRRQSWNLDALGNFESLTNNDGTPVTSTHNLQNQVTGVGSASLSFDANGNMTVDEQGRTFIWDAWNRLVEVKQGSTTLVECQYDGLKRRIVEDDGTSERHLYYSDQWQVLEERVGGDTVTQYVWSAVYVDAMILRDRDADANTGNGLEERIYVLHDANYNVTALVDTSGNVLERYYYEAYGRAVYLDDAFALLPDGQSEHAWQHLHQGGRLDSATGNYYFRHRDLSPSLSRWISQDPIGYEAGDANLYRYVGNGPGTLIDPYGLEEWAWYHPNRYIGQALDYFFGHYGDAFDNDVEGNKNRLKNTEYLGNGRLTCGGNFHVSEGTTTAMQGLAEGAVVWNASGGVFVAANGTTITGYSRHGIHRAIGNGFERAGTSQRAILEAIKRPKSIKSGIDDLGRPYEMFTGQNARVLVNPKSGEIVSVNPLGRGGVRGR
jgi:RHS repeat-associated protein